MSLLAEDKGISISCDASQPVPVKGNRVRLKQVVVNLLDNAIKYTPAKGAIQLRVLAVNGHAVLEVEDNGIGIPPDALPHVFERFYRVDQARSADSESAGLGTFHRQIHLHRARRGSGGAKHRRQRQLFSRQTAVVQKLKIFIHP